MQISTTRVLFPAMCAALLFHATGWAGPPFKTDDPQPVDFRHWEFYLSSIQQISGRDVAATLPHVEVNYGVVPNVQLHFLAPMGYAREGEATSYGYSDTELGVKYRFLEESETLPQMGIFPIVELPTGSKERNLGAGQIQVYLPLWLQKSWGKLSTYGGAGFWYNPGEGNRNWVYLGWQIQYDVSEVVSLGGEAFYQTPDKIEMRGSAGINIGGFINIDESNHILFSLGHDVSGGQSAMGYLGYQLTI